MPTARKSGNLTANWPIVVIRRKSAAKGLESAECMLQIEKSVNSTKRHIVYSIVESTVKWMRYRIVLLKNVSNACESTVMYVAEQKSCKSNKKRRKLCSLARKGTAKWMRYRILVSGKRFKVKKYGIYIDAFDVKTNKKRNGYLYQLGTVAFMLNQKEYDSIRFARWRGRAVEWVALRCVSDISEYFSDFYRLDALISLFHVKHWR